MSTRASVRSSGFILRVLAALGLATVGGLVGVALRVPAGGIIGALLAVGVVNLTTGWVPQLPAGLRRNAQILTGTIIGSGVGPHLIVSLGDFWLAGLLMTVWIVLVGLALGWWISRLTELDLATAMFCFAPGGLTEMVSTAQDVGADARIVAMVGLLRILTTIVSVPLLIGYVILPLMGPSAVGGSGQASGQPVGGPPDPATMLPSSATGLAQLLATLAVGYGGAAFVQRVKLPAGHMLGPILAVGALQILGTPLAELGTGYRYLAQILVGATVASTLTPAILSYMLRVAGPAMLSMLLLVAFGLAGGWVLHLATGLPSASALFAGAPGGVVEMALAAGDLGGDVELVAALQIVRLLFVVIIIPPLLRWTFGGKK